MVWMGSDRFFCHDWDTDNTFARGFAEVGYEQRIGDILCHLWATPFHKRPQDLAEFIGFALLYDCIYLVGNWRYWVGHVDFELRMCTHDRGVLADGTTLSCLQLPLGFKPSCTVGDLSGGVLSRVVEFCQFPSLSSWRTTRIRLSVITRGQELSGTWPPYSSLNWH